MEVDAEVSDFNICAPFAILENYAEDEMDSFLETGDDGRVTEDEDEEVAYTVLQGASIRGKDKLVDSLGYSYTVKRKRKTATEWWCSTRNKTQRCPATVLQKGENFQPGRQSHPHESQPGIKTKLQIVSEAKRDAKTNVDVPASSVVDRAIKEFINIHEPSNSRPAPDLLSRTVNRARQAMRPDEPKDLDFEVFSNVLVTEKKVAPMEELSKKSRSPPPPVADTFIKSECSLAPPKEPAVKTEDELAPVTEVFIKSEYEEVPMEGSSVEIGCELAPVEEVFIKSESVREPEAECSDESVNAPEVEPLCDLECLQGEVLLDVPTTYQLIEGGNKKGGHLLVDSIGYTYSKKRQSSVSIMWSCRIGKKCQATVRQPIGTQDFIRGPKLHNHTGTPGAALKSKIRAQVRAAARQDLFSYSSTIISKVMETVDFTDVDACTELPNRGALLRQANRARENLRPKHPSDLDFTLDVNAIPYDFFQKDIQHKRQRHIILASHMQLELLSKAKVWFLDSSVRVAQKPFKQLFSMHTFLESESVISQFPLCFVYMSRCKAADFKLVIKEIISLIPSELAVKEVVLDFDKSMWLGVQSTLPAVSVQGCWYRWAQAIFLRVKECELQTAYVHKPQVRDLIRLLMALPNLPALHIPNGFNQLKKKCPPDNLELNRIFIYIESTWIVEESRPPHLWSTFQRAVRTYNEADGWHDGLCQNVKSNTLNMYRLFSMLHDGVKRLPEQISLLDLEELRSHRSKQAMHKQFALEQLWTQFEEGNKTVVIHKYLRQCSEFCDHPEDDT